MSLKLRGKSQLKDQSITFDRLANFSSKRILGRSEDSYGEMESLNDDDVRTIVGLDSAAEVEFNTLTVSGDITSTTSMISQGKLEVTDSAGSTVLTGSLDGQGSNNILNDATIGTTLTVQQTSNLKGEVNVTGQLETDSLSVKDSAGDADLLDNVTLDSSLNVSGEANLLSTTDTHSVSGSIQHQGDSTGEFSSSKINISGGSIEGTPIGTDFDTLGNFTEVETTQNLTITGDLTVSGVTTSFDGQSSQLKVSDPLLHLGKGNPSDLVDMGIILSYGSTPNFAGLVRDATIEDGKNKFKLFDSAGDISGVTEIDFDQVNKATLNADIQGDIKFDTSVNISLTGDIVGNADFTGDSIGGITTSIVDSAVDISNINFLADDDAMSDTSNPDGNPEEIPTQRSVKKYVEDQIKSSTETGLQAGLIKIASTDSNTLTTSFVKVKEHAEYITCDNSNTDFNNEVITLSENYNPEFVSLSKVFFNGQKIRYGANKDYVFQNDNELKINSDVLNEGDRFEIRYYIVPSQESSQESSQGSSDPTYSLSSSSTSVNEGGSFTITLTTTNVDDNTLVPYTVSGVDVNDFDGLDSENGNFNITNNSATLDVSVKNNSITELSDQTFTLSLDGLSKSVSVPINDVTPTYSLSSSTTTINEGFSVTLILATSNVPENTVVPFTISGSNIDTNDFSNLDSLGAGEFVVGSNNSATFNLIISSDSTTENAETFTVTLDGLGESLDITINDTSQDPVPTYNALESADNVNEGYNLIIDVSTTNVDDTTLYWTTESNDGDFVASSGSFLLTGGLGSFTVTPIADSTTENAETFTVAIRTGSDGGDIVATTGTITINDASTSPYPAGATVYTVGVESTASGNVYTINGVQQSSLTLNEGSTYVFDWSSTVNSPGHPVRFSETSDGTHSGGSEYLTGVTKEDNIFRTTITVESGAPDLHYYCQHHSGMGSSISTYDPNPSYSAIESDDNVNEGSNLTINVSTTNVADGTLYWTTESNDGDFVASSGSFLLTGGLGSFTVTPIADSTTENAETFTVAIRTGSDGGDIVATTGTITINDTSKDPVPTYNAIEFVNSVNEGSDLTINVTTTNVADTTLFWTTESNDGDFVASSGSFQITSGSGSFVVTPTADDTTEGAETFTVAIRTGSNGGDIVATTGTITINDTSNDTPFFQSQPYSRYRILMTRSHFTHRTGMSIREMELINVSGENVLREGGYFTYNPYVNTHWSSYSPGSTGTPFDGDTGLAWSNNSIDFPGDSNGIHWYEVQLNSPVSLVEFRIYGLTAMRDWKFQGSNDSVTWEDILDFTDYPYSQDSDGWDIISLKHPATYTVSTENNETSIDEGSDLTINVNTTNIFDDTTLFWTIQPNSGDFAVSSGSFVITSNSGSFTITPTDDNTTEASPETFTVQIKIDSSEGNVVAETGVITINDTSQDPVPTYSLSANLDSADEGSTVTLTLQTTHVDENTPVPFTISGSDIEDFVNLDSLGAGEFTIGADGTATFDLELKSDSTTEGPETFTVVLDDHPSISVSVDVNDTSTTPEGPSIYDLSVSSSSINEGQDVTVTLTTKTGESVADGTLVPYTISGVQIEDFNVSSSSEPQENSNIVFASDAGQNDRFANGIAVSDDGSLMVVGAPYWYGVESYQGAVYTYEWDSLNSIWSEVDIFSPFEVYSKRFGAGVTLSGDGTKMVVATFYGQIYTYERNGSSWSEIPNTEIIHPNEIEAQAVSLSSDGTKLVIGDYKRYGSSTQSGKVYTYQWSNGTWGNSGEIPELQPNSGGYKYWFGASVSISSDGNMLAVGSTGFDNIQGYEGIVYIYQWDASSNSWDTTSEVAINNPKPDYDSPYFGSSVSFSGDGSKLAAGTEMYRNGYYGQNTGEAYIFSYDGSSWNLQNEILPNSTEQFSHFGKSLAFVSDASKLLIGSYKLSTGGTNNVNDAGGVYTFSLASSSQLTSLTGNFTVNSNTASLNLTALRDITTEGTETFTLTLDDSGENVSFDVGDTSQAPAYSLSSSSDSADEGTVVTITLDAPGVLNGTTVPFTVSGSGITLSDITSPTLDSNLQGEFTVSSQTASIDFTFSEDITTEGSETFTLTLDSGPSIDIVINDISLDQSFDLSSSHVSVNEGDTVTITLAAPHTPDATLVPYTIDGTKIQTSDLDPKCVFRDSVIENSNILLASDHLDNGNYAEFGGSSSISLDGNIMIVGSPKADINGDGNTGQVYTYQWNDSTSSWDELNKFTEFDYDVNNNKTHYQFGRSLDINDDASILVVSNMGLNGADEIIRTYQWESGTSSWSKINEIEKDKIDSLALSGDGTRLIVADEGAYGTNGRTGTVYTYYAEMDTEGNFLGWGNNAISDNYIANLELDVDRNGWDFGSGVSLSSDGNILVVGAPSATNYYDDLPLPADHTYDPNQTGYVFTYQYDSNSKSWVSISDPLSYDVGGDSYGNAGQIYFGESVSLSSDGKTLAVGCYGEGTSTSRSGAVYVYEFNSGNSSWERAVDMIKAASPVYDELLGWSVSLSGDATRMVSGSLKHNGKGGIYTFDVKEYVPVPFTGESFRVYNGTAEIQFTISNDETTENVAEFLSISLDNGKDSIEIPINDTSKSKTYSLSGPVSVNEHESFQISFYQTGFYTGDLIPYTISGNFQESDFIQGSLSGNFIVSSDSTSTETVTIQLSPTALQSGDEILTLTLDGDLGSIDVLIKDQTYALSTNFSSADEGDTVTITLTTENVSNGTLVPYEISGVQIEDFIPNLSSLTGNFEIQNNQATLELEINYDYLTEGSETLVLDLDYGESSVSVLINDVSLNPSYSISGANSVNEGENIVLSITSNILDGRSVDFTISENTDGTTLLTADNISDVTGTGVTWNNDGTGSFIPSTSDGSVDITIETKVDDVIWYGNSFVFDSVESSLNKSITVNEKSPVNYTVTSDVIQVSEGGSAVNVTVQAENLVGNLSRTVLISSNNTDDATLSSTSLDMTSGSASFTLTPQDDSSLENNESVVLTLTDDGYSDSKFTVNSGNQTAGQGTLDVTIIDNDVANYSLFAGTPPLEIDEDEIKIISVSSNNLTGSAVQFSITETSGVDNVKSVYESYLYDDFSTVEDEWDLYGWNGWGYTWGTSTIYPNEYDGSLRLGVITSMAYGYPVSVKAQRVIHHSFSGNQTNRIRIGIPHVSNNNSKLYVEILKDDVSIHNSGWINLLDNDTNTSNFGVITANGDGTYSGYLEIDYTDDIDLNSTYKVRLEHTQRALSYNNWTFTYIGDVNIYNVLQSEGNLSNSETSVTWDSSTNTGTFIPNTESGSKTLILGMKKDNVIKESNTITLGIPGTSLTWNINELDTFNYDVTATPLIISEGSPAVTVDISASNALNFSSDRTLSIVCDSDQVILSSNSVTIPAGTYNLSDSIASDSFTITPVDDSNVELDQNITITITDDSESSNFTVNGVPSATAGSCSLVVNLLDNDVSVYSLSSTTSNGDTTVNEDGGEVTFTIQTNIIDGQTVVEFEVIENIDDPTGLSADNIDIDNVLITGGTLVEIVNE